MPFFHTVIVINRLIFVVTGCYLDPTIEAPTDPQGGLCSICSSQAVSVCKEHGEAAASGMQSCVVGKGWIQPESL